MPIASAEYTAGGEARRRRHQLRGLLLGNRAEVLSPLRCQALANLQQPGVLFGRQGAVLAGESPEWETTEYVRDAMAEGKRKAVIFLGHCSSEEAGMEYCAVWMKTFVQEMPVEFIPAGDPFWSSQ